MEESFKRLKVSIGVNRKVGSDTAIVNMCSATDCPAMKLGLCQVGGHKKCYAMKSERIWPNVLKSRRKQEKIWDTITVADAVKSLEKKMKKTHRDTSDKQKRELKYLRFSEAGDFRNQEDVDKMSRLAEGLKGKLKVYGYTARRDLDFSKVSSNMVVNGSNFMVHNMFKAVKEVPEGALQCKGNCRTCNLCKENRGAVIYVKIH